MAVVQFFSTDGPEGIEWRQKNFGILSFIKDPNRKSYYFRLYCPIRHQLLWEHELYNGLQYLSLAKFFHCFEAEVKLNKLPQILIVCYYNRNVMEKFQNFFKK